MVETVYGCMILRVTTGHTAVFFRTSSLRLAVGPQFNILGIGQLWYSICTGIGERRHMRRGTRHMCVIGFCVLINLSTRRARDCVYRQGPATRQKTHHNPRYVFVL